MKYCKLDKYPLSTHTWEPYFGTDDEQRRLVCKVCGEIVRTYSRSYEKYCLSAFSPYSKGHKVVSPRGVCSDTDLATCSARMMEKALG